MAANKNKVIKEALKEIEYLSGDEEVRRLEELKDKWQRDYNSGINYAKNEGEKLRS